MYNIYQFQCMVASDLSPEFWIWRTFQPQLTESLKFYKNSRRLVLKQKNVETIRPNYDPIIIKIFLGDIK